MIEKALLEAKDLAEKEYYRCQSLERDSGANIKQRNEDIEICLGYIREALTILERK